MLDIVLIELKIPSNSGKDLMRLTFFDRRVILAAFALMVHRLSCGPIPIVY